MLQAEDEIGTSGGGEGEEVREGRSVGYILLNASNAILDEVQQNAGQIPSFCVFTSVTLSNYF